MNFMRKSWRKGQGERRPGGWRSWLGRQSGYGVNPFNYQVTAPDTAMSLTGEWFWAEDSVTASVQGNSQAVGLLTN